MLLPTMLMLLQATTPSTTPASTPTPSATPTPSTTPTPAPSTTPSVLPTVTALVPVCLARTYKDANGKDQPLTVLVTSLNTELLTAQGFKVQACGTTRVSVTAYETEICKMAGFGNDAVQNRFEEVLGAKPRLLCDEVKKLKATTALTTLLPLGL